MSKLMLVDATHTEEVRVALIDNQRLTNLDVESAAREQIKGNIYLGKITSVEASLQAAFVDFNGGRQGFLSLSDIHDKYYPQEKKKKGPKAEKKKEPPPPADGEQPTDGEQPADEDDNGLTVDSPLDVDENDPPPPPRRPRRHMPIQKLLSKGQKILVQVVKEARGGKGASLTTNLSLPGRYTVFMPDNARGGGISRKIEDQADRKKLKKMLSTLEIPASDSLIIRTAGAGRTKAEIKRDLTYLTRLWKQIQENEKKANAPALVYEEGDLIMRTIRDIYSSDMEQILIEGNEGYRRGKDFMGLLMPRYVKAVQPWKEKVPLFSHYQVEKQIEGMHDRNVRLKSGGSLVVDATEALVAIDINSGRSTREKNIEATAFKTNLEAAEEIARQLRLRDLGGLIVIDFIDMEEKRHNVEVEKKLKEAFKMDRARVRLGRISQFGLLELSRQRMKPAFAEANMQNCPRCFGHGSIRSTSSAAIQVFRAVQMDATSGKHEKLVYHAPKEVADYLQNNKRRQILELEDDNSLEILIVVDDELQTPDFKVEKDPHRQQQEKKGKKGGRKKEQKEDGRQNQNQPKEKKQDQQQDQQQGQQQNQSEQQQGQEGQQTQSGQPGEEGQPGSGKKRRRRRRRRRRGRGGQGGENQQNNQAQGGQQNQQNDQGGQQNQQNDQGGQQNQQNDQGGQQNQQNDQGGQQNQQNQQNDQTQGGAPAVSPGNEAKPKEPQVQTDAPGLYRLPPAPEAPAAAAAAPPPPPVKEAPKAPEPVKETPKAPEPVKETPKAAPPTTASGETPGLYRLTPEGEATPEATPPAEKKKPARRRRKPAAKKVSKETLPAVVKEENTQPALIPEENKQPAVVEEKKKAPTKKRTRKAPTNKAPAKKAAAKESDAATEKKPAPKRKRASTAKKSATTAKKAPAKKRTPAKKKAAEEPSGDE